MRIVCSLATFAPIASRSVGTGLSEPKAEATKTVETAGEEELKVWEFTIDLRVVALRGSVPNQWVEDFKQVGLKSSQQNTYSCSQVSSLVADHLCSLYGLLQPCHTAAHAVCTGLGEIWHTATVTERPAAGHLHRAGTKQVRRGVTNALCDCMHVVQHVILQEEEVCKNC